MVQSRTADVASPPTTAPAPAPEPLGSRFHHLLAATGSSNLSDGILTVGVPLLAVTYTRDPAHIGLLATALYLPWLLLAAHVGVLVDRCDRVRVLLLATAARTVLLAGVAVAASAGALSMPLLLGVLLAYGVTDVFADSAATVLVPDVAPRSRLGAANGRVLGAQQVMNAFVGGPIAGPLLALGAGWVFGLPAALTAAAGLLVLRGLHGKVRHVASSAPVGADGRPQRGRTWADLVAGLRYVRGHAVVRPMLVVATVANTMNAAYFAVFVLWVVGPGSRVGLAPEAYGLLLAGLAIGAVLGALTSERLGRRFAETTLLRSAWLLNAALLAVPVLVPEAWAVAGALFGCGFTNTVGNVVGQSMRQRLVPSRLLGRVGGVGRMLSYGGMPVGAALGGLVGQVAGLPVVLGGAVAACAVAVLWFVRAVPQRLVDEADAALVAEAAAQA